MQPPDYNLHSRPVLNRGLRPASTFRSEIPRVVARCAATPAAARDEILHTVACKAAIKAGWDTDIKELERLVEAVLSGEIRYCPHGRPISVAVTRRDLDKLFRRIV